MKDVAVWYPLRVIMMILGVPPEDEALMLKLTQELLAPLDKDMRTKAAGRNLISTVEDFFAYFRQIAAERRREPRDDVASVIANATIDGQPLGEIEAMSYYVIIATAGHDSTSSTAAGGLLALIENPEQLAKLGANPAHIPSAIDEMVRWVSPVAHFFRTATEDYELRGQQIRVGDALMMCYPSANRDEAVFDEPFAFRIDRSPNRHLAFGYGPHLCLGQHLAKLELRALFKELLPRLERIELAGPPAWTESYFVGGLKRLPIRYALRR